MRVIHRVPDKFTTRSGRFPVNPVLLPRAPIDVNRSTYQTTNECFDRITDVLDHMGLCRFHFEILSKI
jgi:hypothetical protein